MSVQTVNPTIEIDVTTLADGLVIRLSGRLDDGCVPALRAGLLAPRPAGRDDVLVDAGSVERVDDAALAVLVAAPRWAHETGGRLSYTRVSDSLRATAQHLQVEDALPLLAAPGRR